MKKMKLFFILKKGKTNSEGNTAIYGQIVIGSSMATFATGKFISPQRWEETNHLRNVVKKDEGIKTHLRLLEDKINQIYTEVIKDSENYLTADTIKSILLGKEVEQTKNSKTVLQAIDFHNHYFEKLVDKGEKALGTLDRYKCVRKIVAEFIQKEYGISDFEIKKMDTSFVYRLETYLRTAKAYKRNIGCGNNTTVKYIRNLKTIFNFVLKQGSWLESNPFLVYDEKLKPVNTVYLEEDELEAIQNKEFDCERLNTVRNIFLFSCYTAYSPVDAMKLTWSNIEEQADNEKIIKALRTKTKIKANVLLLPQAEKIINYYKDDPRCANDNRLLPKFSNQKMNAYLKEIADVCRIKKKITWMVSRHTFATTVTLNNNVPIEVVSSAMGHTNIRQTQHYAKVKEKMVVEQMKRLKQKFIN